MCLWFNSFIFINYLREINFFLSLQFSEPRYSDIVAVKHAEMFTL